MKPRQLVIVHGPPEASLDLAESCKAFSKDIKVYTPKLQETIDATSETHIYQVSYSNSLLLLCLVSVNCSVTFVSDYCKGAFERLLGQLSAVLQGQRHGAGLDRRRAGHAGGEGGHGGDAGGWREGRG